MKPNNPPAFPGLQATDLSKKPASGMTLRDYFAAVALQGLIARAENLTDTIGEPVDFPGAAYEYADLMLEARSKD